MTKMDKVMTEKTNFPDRSYLVPRRGEDGQNLDKLNNWSGPAVNDEQRQHLFALRLDRIWFQVDEVDVQSVDASLELRELAASNKPFIFVADDGGISWDVCPF